MRIIKEGRLKSEKVYQPTCNDCKTIFEFKQGEANYVSDQRDGDCLQINCPFCGQVVTVGVKWES